MKNIKIVNQVGSAISDLPEQHALDLVQNDLEDARFEMKESLTHDNEMLESVQVDGIPDNHEDEKEISLTINRGRRHNRQSVGHATRRGKVQKPKRS